MLSISFLCQCLSVLNHDEQHLIPTEHSMSSLNNNAQLQRRGKEKNRNQLVGCLFGVASQLLINSETYTTDALWSFYEVVFKDTESGTCDTDLSIFLTTHPAVGYR